MRIVLYYSAILISSCAHFFSYCCHCLPPGWETNFISDAAAADNVKAQVISSSGNTGKGRATPLHHLTPHTAPFVTSDGSPSDEELVHQVKQAASAILKYTGKHSCVFRPPYALRSNPSRGGTAMSYYTSKQADLVHSQTQHQVILWSLEAPGYGDESATAIAVRDAVLSKAKKGDVILFHITPATVASLGSVLDALFTQGYEMLTVSEMLSFPDDKPP